MIKISQLEILGLGGRTVRDLFQRREHPREFEMQYTFADGSRRKKTPFQMDLADTTKQLDFHLKMMGCVTLTPSPKGLRSVFSSRKWLTFSRTSAKLFGSWSYIPK